MQIKLHLRSYYLWRVSVHELAFICIASRHKRWGFFLMVFGVWLGCLVWWCFGFFGGGLFVWVCFFKSQWDIFKTKNKPIMWGRPIWKSLLSVKRFRPHLPSPKTAHSPSGPIREEWETSTYSLQFKAPNHANSNHEYMKVTFSSADQTTNFNTQQPSSKLWGHLGSE